MADKTKIAWCDSTFNPWIGCTKIGPGCDHCYAAVQDSRKRWGGTTHWGAGVARYRTSASTWAQPVLWDAKQQDLMRQGDAPPWRVFCASLADVFDNEVPQAWRDDLFYLISQTPNLSWLLVTKRISNVPKMMHPSLFKNLPNFRLLITVCNQEEADRDIPKLLALPCKNGISYEPALGPVDWSVRECRHDEGYVEPDTNALVCRKCEEGNDLGGIEWIIVGGESGPKARPFDFAWARDTVAQCNAAGVPVFIKQMGSRPLYEFTAGCDAFPKYADRAGADPAEWPKDLQVREFP